MVHTWRIATISVPLLSPVPFVRVRRIFSWLPLSVGGTGPGLSHECPGGGLLLGLLTRRAASVTGRVQGVHINTELYS